jgi:cell volume regulation protein A
MAVSFSILIAGLIILTGFLGTIFFERTRIPDVLFLLGIGIIIGPVSGLVDPHDLSHVAEYFGTLALIIILFEGGMDMDIDKLLKEFGTASLLVAVSFFLTIQAIGAFLFHIYNWDLKLSLLLGTILGCTSAAIVIPIVSRLNIREEVKTIVFVESALSDVLAIVMTISLIELVNFGSIGINAPFKAVASSFSTAIVMGGLSGLLWLKILDLFRDRKYSYMVTLAAVLITYGLVQFFGGSGPISVLVFGLILGNSHDFSRFLKIRSSSLIDSTIKFFHGEMTFFIRTFFFVYIGMMVSPRVLDADHLRLGITLFLLIILVRIISVGFTVTIYKEKKCDRFILFSMMPRGLASAVLATLPASVGVKGSEYFVDLTFIIIILTNLLMTFGVVFTDRTHRHDNGPPSVPLDAA